MSDPTPAPAAPQPPPAKSGNRTLVIILSILGAMILLIGGCVGACTYIAAKKAREYARTAESNPTMAALSFAASIHPDLEVVSRDDAAGTITIRNKRSGQQKTFDTHQYNAENIGAALESLSSAAAAAGAAPATSTPESQRSEPDVETSPPPAETAGGATGALASFPPYLPPYPGGTTVESNQMTIAAARMSSYIFTTSDKPEKVVEFYRQKVVAAGFKVMGQNSSNEGSPSAEISLMRDNPQGAVNISAETELNGKVRVVVGLTETAGR